MSDVAGRDGTGADYRLRLGCGSVVFGLGSCFLGGFPRSQSWGKARCSCALGSRRV